MIRAGTNLNCLLWKDGQLVTGGIFYCRDSAKINGCGSLQTLSWLDSDLLRNRQQKHTANPLWASGKQFSFVTNISIKYKPINFKTMKKTILLFTVLITAFSIKAHAQNVNIPDSNFKNFLLSKTEINTNEDMEIQVTEANSFSGKINCNNKSITDLTGIEEFINLTKSECYYNNISNLNFAANTNLRYINCSYSYVNSLILPEGTNLTALYCHNNLITNLDISTSINLDSLNCRENDLESINLSTNTHLSDFSCEYNEINNLDVSNNLELVHLYVNGNNLSSLDISNNTLLIDLGCYSNELTNIDLSNNINLETLSLNFNNLTNLDVSNNLGLRYLRCKENNLSNLDLTLNTELVILSCQSNNLTCLNIKNGNNTEFDSFVGYFNATDNPNLTCIEVDDVLWSEVNMENIDTTASFSEDCPDCTNAISPINEDVNINIYPNPTNGQVIILGEDFEEVKIFNLCGILIQETKSKEIDLSKQPKGIYFFKIKTKEVAITRKIVLQ